MHSLGAQIGLRVALGIALAVLAPVLGFLWWRLGWDELAERWIGWRQRTARQLLGQARPEVFYTDTKGVLRKYKPRWLAVVDGVLVSIALAFAALMVVCFVSLASQSERPLLAIAGVLVLTGCAALYVRSIVKR
jgi:hypothetical protein